MADETIYEIPLNVAVAQKLNVTLGGLTFVFQVRWNEFSEIWNLDIYQEDGTTACALNVPMRAGVNLLGQFPSSGVPGRLFVFTEGDPNADPTVDNLGDGCKLYWTAE